VSIPRTVWRLEPGLNVWSVLVAYRGSIAHGTYLPGRDPTSVDDKDVMAFCVPPLDHYYGLAQFGSRGTVELVRDPWDIVIYEIRKVAEMLEKGNPNVLSILWLPDNLYLKRTPAGEILIRNRDVFVGRHVYRSFTHYAAAQLQAIEGGVYKGYMGDRRRALVEQFGYDTKNASHLIRLLRQGIEFLNDGHLYVQRHDAAELVAIKRGEWPLERVKAEAERLFRRADDAYDRSTLPVQPDHARVNELCVEVVHEALHARGEAR
jgi:predicted nucleotidyltransferase